jgi:hypothetical protein
VQINRLRWLFTALDSEDGIDNIGCKLLSKLCVKLGSERCVRDGDEVGSVECGGLLVAVEELVVSL